MTKGEARTNDGGDGEHPSPENYIVYVGQIIEIVIIYICLHTPDIIRALGLVVKSKLEVRMPEVEGSILGNLEILISDQNSLKL